MADKKSQKEQDRREVEKRSQAGGSDKADIAPGTGTRGGKAESDPREENV